MIDDLFAPPNKKELNERYSQLVVETLSKVKTTVPTLSEEDSEIMGEILSDLKEFAEQDEKIKANWNLLYPVFLAIVITYIKKKNVRSIRTTNSK